MRLESKIEDNCYKNDECVICLEACSKPAKLYCGHIFCRKCILQIGQYQTKCPICSRHLCLDVCPNRDTLQKAGLESGFSKNGNLDPDYSSRYKAFWGAFDTLSDDQVKAEALEFGIIDINRINKNPIDETRSKLKAALFQCHKRAWESEPHISMELSSSHSITNCREFVSAENANSFVSISPKEGPVLIEIGVKGIPVVAKISNNSRYTICSPTFVKTFGLKLIEGLSTKRMRCALTGTRLRDVTCIEEFELSVGGATVTLNNALHVGCISNADFNGIQLGQDFLLSGAFCSITTFMGDEPGMTCHVDGMLSAPRTNVLYSEE
mmetsp:Transcript_29892/g.43523  ORF Transcript_29892/g.43523 Transcript_29892/m.43523 type:complete len:324 (+) Transcript_29892:484-1455(+)